MSENYRFFQHKECEYFPCHDIKDVEDFNCLFCYCPLYFIEACGGNNIKNNGIKNCMNCTVPHMKKNYDLIINKIIEENKKNSK